MSSLRAALIALFAASVAMAAVMVALVVSSDHETAKPLMAVLGPFIGLSFCGTGVFGWLRRPHNRFGALMTSVGFAWFLSGLIESNDPWVYTLGVYLGPLYLVLVGHMLLAFPSGRLETTQARALVALAYLTALAVQVPFFLLGGDISGNDNAPRHAWALVDEPDSATVFSTVAQLVAAALIVWLAFQLFDKRQVASPPQRRAMAPVLWTGVVLMGTLAVAVIDQLFGAASPVVSGPSVASLVAFAALPWAFVIGLLRTRYSRAGAVGDLVERLNAQGIEGESLRDALAEALGDRSLALAFWSRGSERYVDSHGQPVELPPATSRSRAVTENERESVPVAAIVHDAALLDEPGLVGASGRGARGGPRGRAGAGERAAGGRAQGARRRAAGLARQGHRGRHGRAPRAGAQPPRRRPAAARRAVAAARAGQDEAAHRPRRGRADPRRRAHRAGQRAGRAARARPRHPPGDPDRPRPGPGAGGAGLAGARAGRGRRRSRRADADAGGGRRVLRRRRVPDQHGQVRRRRICERPRSQGE